MAVQDRLDGKGEELLIRFTARHRDRDGVAMFAIGPIDPDTCKVGEMKAAVGKNIYADAENDSFQIP